MSLQLQEIPPIPEETRRVARAAFPKGNRYVRLRDELGTIFDDPLFAPWFPTHGQPAAIASLYRLWYFKYQSILPKLKICLLIKLQKQFLTCWNVLFS